MRNLRTVFLLFLIVLLIPFAACGKSEDLFARFRGAYRADIAGELHGVSFGAVLEADAVSADGSRALTLTFYAPESLFGTVLRQDSVGELSITAGEVSATHVHPEGFLPLLHLLPTEGAVKEIALDEAGHSVVTGEGFTLVLLEDGTPIAAANADASATIVLFEAR